MGASAGLEKETNTHEAYTQQFTALCRKCGARRIDQQIGLEALPFCRGGDCGECYLCVMVAVSVT